MKSSLFGWVVAGWCAGIFLIHAQTNAPATTAPSPQVAREMKMIAFLTPAQQEQYAKARAQALEDNPALKTEGESLMQQGEAVMSNGTTEEKQGFLVLMNEHRQKLRAAMLKVDPTLGPIFAEIDTHLAQMKARTPAGPQK